MVLPSARKRQLQIWSGFQPLGGSGQNPTRLRWERWDPRASRSLPGHRGTVIYSGSSLHTTQSLTIKAGSGVTQFLPGVFHPTNPLPRSVGRSRQRGSPRQGAPEAPRAAEPRARLGRAPAEAPAKALSHRRQWQSLSRFTPPAARSPPRLGHPPFFFFSLCPKDIGDITSAALRVAG